MKIFVNNLNMLFTFEKFINNLGSLLTTQILANNLKITVNNEHI